MKMIQDMLRRFICHPAHCAKNRLQNVGAERTHTQVIEELLKEIVYLREQLKTPFD